MPFCECGCGTKGPGQFRRGHNSKGRRLSESHKDKLRVAATNVVFTSERKARMSAAAKKRDITYLRSDEMNSKRSKALHGRAGLYVRTPEMRAAMSAARLTANPGYYAVHERMRCLKTGQCAQCEITGTTEMALIHDRETHIDNVGQYSTDLTAYQELCKSCHRRYDNSASNLKFREACLV